MSNPISNVTLVYDDNHDSFEHVEHHSAHDSTVRELYALVGPDNVNTAEISTNPQHTTHHRFKFNHKICLKPTLNQSYDSFIFPPSVDYLLI